MHCTLKGTGGEEEDPPDVLWLRDGSSLHYTDTNQFQVHTGSNSWTVISTLRWVELPCSACWTGRINRLLSCGSHTSCENVCNASWLVLVPVPPLHPVTLLNQTIAYISLLTCSHQIYGFNLHDRIRKSWRKIISALYIFMPPCHFYYHCLISQHLVLHDLYYISTE